MRISRTKIGSMLVRSHLSRIVALLLCGAPIACGPSASPQDGKFQGNSRQGAIEIYRAACGSCHVIPGVVGADGVVGPSLERFASRKFIAGLLPNTPDNLSLWIEWPQRIAPGNVMPNMGLSAREARDIAAYLETLR